MNGSYEIRGYGKSLVVDVIIDTHNVGVLLLEFLIVLIVLKKDDLEVVSLDGLEQLSTDTLLEHPVAAEEIAGHVLAKL